MTNYSIRVQFSTNTEMDKNIKCVFRSKMRFLFLGPRWSNVQWSLFLKCISRCSLLSQLAAVVATVILIIVSNKYYKYNVWIPSPKLLT